MPRACRAPARSWPRRVAMRLRAVRGGGRRPHAPSSGVRVLRRERLSGVAGHVDRQCRCLGRWCWRRRSRGPVGSAGCLGDRRSRRPCSLIGIAGAVYAVVLVYTVVPRAWGAWERSAGEGRNGERRDRVLGVGRAARAADLAARGAGARGGRRLGVRGGAGPVPGPSRHGVGGAPARGLRQGHEVHRRLHRVLLRDRARRQRAARRTPISPAGGSARATAATASATRRGCATTSTATGSPGTVFPGGCQCAHGDCAASRGRLQPLPLRAVQHPDRRHHRGRVPAGRVPEPRDRRRR